MSVDSADVEQAMAAAISGEWRNAAGIFALTGAGTTTAGTRGASRGRGEMR